MPMWGIIIIIIILIFTLITNVCSHGMVGSVLWYRLQQPRSGSPSISFLFGYLKFISGDRSDNSLKYILHSNQN